MFDRRQLLLGMGATALPSSATPSDANAAEQPAWLAASDDIQFAAGITARLDRAIADKQVWNLHGLIVLRDQRVVIERYFEGPDQARGIGKIGNVAFTPTTLHDLRSCSKSIVALLYGIALQQGKVPAPETPLHQAFPEYADIADKADARLTVHHVLTMTMGIDWDESSLPYADLRNSETAMDAAPERYRYILERPIIDAPGAHWRYCGGATALLARLIAKGTGMTLHDFARKNLFDPLGLGPTEWAGGADGEPFAASGARMAVRDLAKIGLLMLSGGAADGRQIVPADWITRCTTIQVSADELRRYGYQWWLLDVAFGQPRGWAAGRLERMWMAQGEGGQRLFIIPALNLIIAITAGNYGKDDQWMPPTRVLREVVLPSLA